MGIASGSWIYIFKQDTLSMVVVLIGVFFLSSFGIFSNLLKLNDLHIELKGIKNG